MNSKICLTAFAISLAMAVSASSDQNVQFVIGQDVDAIEEYVKTFRHSSDGVMAYTSLKDLEGLWSESNHGGGRQHAQLLIEKYPRAFLQLGLYLVDILQDIPKGAYDKNLDQLAHWFKSFPNQVYLRIGYEFDGPHNHYESAQYVLAYRYIVGYLRNQNVKNVQYVWHSYAGYVDGGNIMRWYPGDDDVEWVGISFFDAYSGSFRANVAKIAKDLDKPLMIAESTPYKIGVMRGEKSWRMWFNRYFDFIRKNDVKMFCYINWDWDQYLLFKGQGWGNGRIQDDPYIREKWIEELKSHGYIN